MTSANSPSSGSDDVSIADTPSRRWGIAGAGLVAALALVAMAPTLRGTFLPGDDQHFVLNHTFVSNPGLANALSLLGIVHRDLYQPVPMMSFAMDTALYGDRAWGFHLTNVLWHCLAAVLVWTVVGLRWGDWWWATLAGALFAVHPQAVEAVSVVSVRFVEMGVVFSLASIGSFLIWSRHPRGEAGWLAAAVLLAVLAMTSKVQIALPVLLLLVTYGQQRRSGRAWWTAWGVLCGITIGFVALALWTTSRTGVIASAMAELPGSLSGRALMAMGIYLAGLVWPAGLSTWYIAPASWSWSHPLIWIGAAGLAVLVAATVVCLRRGRVAVGIGLAWYVVAIVPMLWASSARNLTAADRYTYLANIGAFVVIGRLLVSFVRQAGHRASGKVVAATSGVLAVAVLVALTLASWSHAAHYRTGLAYYRRVAELYPAEPWVNLNLGWELARVGELDQAREAANAEMALPGGDQARAYRLLGWIAEKQEHLDQAERHLTAAVEARPRDADAQYDLARLLRKRGRLELSRAGYEKALSIEPGHLPSLIGLGAVCERIGPLAKAANALERALRVSPQHVNAMARLATVRLRQGMRDEAEQLFRRALDLDSGNAQARTNLAAILAQTGREREALQHYNAILSRRPEFMSARLNRADLHRRRGHNSDAAIDYRAALSIEPGCVPALEGVEEILYAMTPEDAGARSVGMWAQAIKSAGARPDLLAGLAMAQASAGKVDQAEQSAGRCLAEQPKNPAAHLSLVVVAMRRGQTDQAIDLLERVCAGPTDPELSAALQRTTRIIGLFGLKHRGEPLPYFLLGRILLSQNQTALAKRTFEDLMRVTKDKAWQDRVRRILLTDR